MTRQRLVKELAKRGINPATLKTARTEWLQETLNHFQALDKLNAAGRPEPGTVYHISRALKKTARPGYRNPGNVERYNGTFCGADPTRWDISARDPAPETETFVPCPECVAIREGVAK